MREHGPQDSDFNEVNFFSSVAFWRLCVLCGSVLHAELSVRACGRSCHTQIGALSVTTCTEAASVSSTLRNPYDCASTVTDFRGIKK